MVYLYADCLCTLLWESWARHWDVQATQRSHCHWWFPPSSLPRAGSYRRSPCFGCAVVSWIPVAEREKRWGDDKRQWEVQGMALWWWTDHPGVPSSSPCTTAAAWLQSFGTGIVWGLVLQPLQVQQPAANSFNPTAPLQKKLNSGIVSPEVV